MSPKVHTFGVIKTLVTELERCCVNEYFHLQLDTESYELCLECTFSEQLFVAGGNKNLEFLWLVFQGFHLVSKIVVRVMLLLDDERIRKRNR